MTFAPSRSERLTNIKVDDPTFYRVIIFNQSDRKESLKTKQETLPDADALNCNLLEPLSKL